MRKIKEKFAGQLTENDVIELTLMEYGEWKTRDYTVKNLMFDMDNEFPSCDMVLINPYRTLNYSFYLVETVKIVNY